MSNGRIFASGFSLVAIAYSTLLMAGRGFVALTLVDFTRTVFVAAVLAAGSVAIWGK